MGGIMTTHSKGSYVAYRSERNAPTSRQKQWLARQLKQFCEEPFPNSAIISYDRYGNDVFVMDIKTRSVVYP